AGHGSARRSIRIAMARRRACPAGGRRRSSVINTLLSPHPLSTNVDSGNATISTTTRINDNSLHGGLAMGSASRAACVLLLTAAAGWAAAQNAGPGADPGAGHFDARLSTAPIDLGNAAAVKGGGSVSAVLDGAELR